MKYPRNAAFDIAKCFAMYLVVLGHLIADRMDDPAYVINLLHLPVLFFISGFFCVSSVENRSAGELLKRKSVTLLVPFLIWSGISLAANCALMLLQGEFSLRNFMNEALQIFVYARSVWFLAQLFLTFVIFLGIYKLAGKVRWGKYRVFIYLAVWLTLSALLPGDVMAFHKFKWLFPFFLAGYLLGKHWVKISVWLQTHKKLSLLGWLSLLYPVLVAVFVHEDACRQYTNFLYDSLPGVLHGLLYYVISTAGVVLVMLVSHWVARTPVGKVLAETGTYSMDIYVIHMFLIKFIPIPVDVNTANPIFAISLLAAITLVIVIAIRLLSKYVLRRIKLFRISIGLN